MSHTRWSTCALLGIAALACFTQACGNKEATNVKQQAYGKMPDGTPIELYTLTNANGMQAGIMTYGGIVTSLTAPDKSAKFADIVLGTHDLPGYQKETA